MNITKKRLKQIIIEELKSIKEQRDGFEIDMDLGTLLRGNLIRVNVSESDTDNSKIRINSINVQDAKEFIDAIAAETPFEEDMKFMTKHDINNFEIGLQAHKKSASDAAWDDWAADRAADRADKEDF